MADPLPAVLRTARRRRGLTQEQVGRLLDPPINHSLVSRYESGLRVPSSTLDQLAKILHIKLTTSACIEDVEPVAS